MDIDTSLEVRGKLRTLPLLIFCQEFGLARFKSNVTKTMKGFEYILAKLQGENLPGTGWGQVPAALTGVEPRTPHLYPGQMPPFRRGLARRW